MKIIRDFILPVVVAVAVYALLHFSVASFKVYGVSMLPTVRPDEQIMVSKVAYFVHQPERGDIIVLHSPREGNVDLIKRVIALPGDTVEIKNRKVIVNGKPLDEPYIAEPPNYEIPKMEIPDGQYFVLGDNRNHSSDSHVGWTAPRENIVGKTWMTYWPPQMWRIIKSYPQLVSIQPAGVSDQIMVMVTPWPTK